ncbi:MAG: ATP-binding protein [Desulfobacteraceae bacterium]|nr:ATP-binding protein [Desulfobacteraceae bacterium]
MLMQGARQTGKTYLLQEFGRREYETVIYCNFEETSGLDQLFSQDLNPDRILADLSLFLGHPIRPQKDLLIFDEIQISNSALNSLKYFCEKRNDIHIAAAGSLLGIKLSQPGSFPVGKVNYLHLYPMTFLEYLEAVGEQRYVQLIDSAKKPIPFNALFHEHLIDLLRQYFVVGGMPEAVQQYIETKNVSETRRIQNEIIKSYVLDFVKHAPSAEVSKLFLIWDSIPGHLARENKKFIFSALKKGARGKTYENAIVWLEDAGLIHRVHAVAKAEHPLKFYADRSCFKVYALDIGLLGAMAGLPVELMVQGKQLFNELQGALTENYATQQLVAHCEKPLFYWRSKGGRAELDFLIEGDTQVYPLEVKAGINPKSKSLTSYDSQFNPQTLIRTNLLNLKQNGKILNLPLYAVSKLNRINYFTTRPYL